jgi:hypothetical protein
MGLRWPKCRDIGPSLSALLPVPEEYLPSMALLALPYCQSQAPDRRCPLPASFKTVSSSVVAARTCSSRTKAAEAGESQV